MPSGPVPQCLFGVRDFGQSRPDLRATAKTLNLRQPEIIRVQPAARCAKVAHRLRTFRELRAKGV